MKKIIFMSLILQCILFAQGNDLLYVYDGRAAVLFLARAPGSGETVRIFRSEGGGSAIDLTGAAPLKAANQPADVYRLLGGDLEQIKKYMDAEDDFDVYLALKDNAGRGGIISLLFPGAAIASGRLFYDTTAAAGKTYNYRVVYYLDSTETGRIEKTVKAVVPILKEPSKLKGDVRSGILNLTWTYPKWEDDNTNFTVSFKVYRKSANGVVTLLNNRPILRNDNADPDFTAAVTEETFGADYYVTAVDFAGNESKPSAMIKIKEEELPLPLGPTGLKAEPTDYGISLFWEPSIERNVRGYNVFRRDVSARDTILISKKEIPAESPFYLDSTAASGRQYFYFVKAITKDGRAGRFSLMEAAMYEDRIPPLAPSNLRLSIQNKTIKLEWTKSASKDVGGYRIYRGYEKGIMPRIDILAQGSSFIDSGYFGESFEAGRTSFYSISAVDYSDNESPRTEVVKIVFPDKEAPELPGLFYTNLGELAVVQLSIGPSPSRDIEKVSVFKKKIGDKGNAQLYKTLNALPAELEDTSCLVGQKYVYQIQLTDTAGNSSAMLTGDTVSVANTLPPPQVPVVAASVLEKGVEIKWLGVVQYDLAGYNIYKCEIPNGSYRLINKSPVKGERFTDSAGLPDTYYKLRAVNTSGVEGAWSEVTGVYIKKEIELPEEDNE